MNLRFGTFLIDRQTESRTLNIENRQLTAPRSALSRTIAIGVLCSSARLFADLQKLFNAHLLRHISVDDRQVCASTGKLDSHRHALSPIADQGTVALQLILDTAPETLSEHRAGATSPGVGYRRACPYKIGVIAAVI